MTDEAEVPEWTKCIHHIDLAMIAASKMADQRKFRQANYALLVAVARGVRQMLVDSGEVQHAIASTNVYATTTNVWIARLAEAMNVDLDVDEDPEEDTTPNA